MAALPSPVHPEIRMVFYNQVIELYLYIRDKREFQLSGEITKPWHRRAARVMSLFGHVQVIPGAQALLTLFEGPDPSLATVVIWSKDVEV